MNFIFEWSTRYLTRSLRSLVRYRVDHSKIKFISTRGHVISSISSQTSATDVLKAMGAMPRGFRSTTLGKTAKEGKLLRTSAPITKHNSCYWIKDILSNVCRSGSLVIYKMSDNDVKKVFRERELSERGNILRGLGCRRIYHGGFSVPYFYFCIMFHGWLIVHFCF